MYSTPELLLVGAAQHLVMGNSLMSIGTQSHCAPGDIDNEAGETYIDDAAW